MMVLWFLLAVPLSVAVLGAFLRLRDGGDVAAGLRALAVRLLLVLAVVWLSGSILVPLAAFALVLLSQIVWFYGTRMMVTRR